MRAARQARLPGAAAARAPQARLILAAALALLAGAAQAEPLRFPPSDFEVRRAEALAREKAAADAEAARRQTRLNLRATVGAPAPTGAAPSVGVLADPSLFAELAVLGVLGASAVAAFGSDASPIAQAGSGSAAPAPAAPEQPGATPGTTATSTN